MFKLPANLFPALLLMLVSLHSAQAQPNLTESLKQDVALQDATIIAMRSALGAKTQTTVIRRSGFLLEIQIYVDTYREMRDANTLANIQSRYSAAKAEMLEPRLPATIEELVSILEEL